LRQFEKETGLQVKPVDLRDLDSMATSEYERPWKELTRKERLQVCRRLLLAVTVVAGVLLPGSGEGIQPAAPAMVLARLCACIDSGGIRFHGNHR